MASRTWLSGSFIGSRLSGRNDSLISSYGTSDEDPQNEQRCPTRSGSNTEMAWQLWHLTEIFFACQPRWESGMPRRAATKSCSTITSSPVAVNCACAGEVVPQNGQTSAFLAGFHCASPPHAGQENFFWARTSGTVDGLSHSLRLQKLIQRRARDSPRAADLFALERAFGQGGLHIRFGDSKHFGRVRRAEQFRRA